MTFKKSEQSYSALVLGATGGIGGAFFQAFTNDKRYQRVDRIDRTSFPDFDLADEDAISSAVRQCLNDGVEYDMIVDATGVLEVAGVRPERSISELSYENMTDIMKVNAIGPALLLSLLTPSLKKGTRAIYLKLGARVGSIEDNQLGGWYSYRASKAALCQVIKSAAIEQKRRQPRHVIVAMHPGTVDTKLSANYRTKHEKLSAPQSVSKILGVIEHLSAEDSGGHFDYKGERIPG